VVEARVWRAIMTVVNTTVAKAIMVETIGTALSSGLMSRDLRLS